VASFDGVRRTGRRTKSKQRRTPYLADFRAEEQGPCSENARMTRVSVSAEVRGETFPGRRFAAGELESRDPNLWPDPKIGAWPGASTIANAQAVGRGEGVDRYFLDEYESILYPSLTLTCGIVAPARVLSFKACSRTARILEISRT
jgi:hypothetical protein